MGDDAKVIPDSLKKASSTGVKGLGSMESGLDCQS